MPGNSGNPDEIDDFVKTYRKRVDQARSDSAVQKPAPGTLSACKNLDMLGALIDGTFDGQKNETRISAPMLTEPEDSIWNTLIDCSEATNKPSERAESLRVAAIWERLRADTFRKMYLEQIGEASSARAVATLPKTSAPNLGRTVAPLEETQAAVEDPILRAIKEGDTTQEREQQERALRTTMAEPSILVTIGVSEHLSDEEFTRVSVHNRALCDQVIVVTRLTPASLALEYGSQDGRKFLKKNYPRVCLLQDTTHFAPGIPRYLLVYADFKNDFSGFQAVQHSTNTPVYGSGTGMNAYGNTWNFTYSGTVETTGTVQTPYIVSSQSLFLNAYGENGELVSQHSITTSSQTGGDPAYAAGYNTDNVVSQLWSNPQRLAASVLKDVQKDSVKYSKN